MKIKVLASGSKGNSTLIICDNTKIIIDIGITYTRLIDMLKDIDIKKDDLSALLISHSHSDHIRGVEQLIKHTNTPIYIPEEMYKELKEIIPMDRCRFISDSFYINDVKVDLIHTSHDTQVSVGYIIEYKNKKLSHVTDTGYINRKYLKRLEDMDLYVMESNYDDEMLMDGPYPRFLKERVVSDIGHLSNKMTASYLKKLTTKRTKHIVLAHLSEKNNTKEKAYNETYEVVKDKNIKVLIAEQDVPTELVEV